MITRTILQAGSWPVDTASDTVLIDHDRRFRRRFRLLTEQGQPLLLDLPQAARLRQDDGLVLENGQIVRVCARAEKLLHIAATDPALLLRLAWHLGNRHLPVQFLGTALRIRADHVIADMVRGLGGSADPIDAPFDPEAGAYGGTHRHHLEDHDDVPEPGHAHG